MVDLSSEMAALAERLGPAPGAIARVLQFVSAEKGEGASTIAREFAREVSRNASRGVWLLELDLMKGEQHAVIAADPQVYGRLSEPVRATPGSEMFFSVTPPREGDYGRTYQDANYLAAHQVGGARWWVGRFRRELLVGGQAVPHPVGAELLGGHARARRLCDRGRSVLGALAGGGGGGALHGREPDRRVG